MCVKNPQPSAGSVWRAKSPLVGIVDKDIHSFSYPKTCSMNGFFLAIKNNAIVNDRVVLIDRG